MGTFIRLLLFSDPPGINQCLLACVCVCVCVCVLRCFLKDNTDAPDGTTVSPTQLRGDGGGAEIVITGPRPTLVDTGSAAKPEPPGPSVDSTIDKRECVQQGHSESKASAPVELSSLRMALDIV